MMAFMILLFIVIMTQVSFRVCIKCLFAARRTKVIRFTFIFRFKLSRSTVYHHPANQIFYLCHFKHSFYIIGKKFSETNSTASGFLFSSHRTHSYRVSAKYSHTFHNLSPNCSTQPPTLPINSRKKTGQMAWLGCGQTAVCSLR